MIKAKSYSYINNWLDIDNILKYSVVEDLHDTIAKENPALNEINEVIFKILQEQSRKKENPKNDETAVREIADELEDMSFHAEAEKGRNAANKKPKTSIYYYKVPKSKIFGVEENEYYIFSPSWVTVLRASQAELGDNVLGLAYPGLKLVKILDCLCGNDYKEVLQHELNHIFFPHMSEQDIRYMTKRELPFYTRYH